MLIHVVSNATHEWMGYYPGSERYDIEVPSGVFRDSSTTPSRPALFSSGDENGPYLSLWRGVARTGARQAASEGHERLKSLDECLTQRILPGDARYDA